MYSVPEKIAVNLGLSKLRKPDGDGCYLLSSQDLRAYGIDRALSEGARGLTKTEAKEMFNL